jgi:hypothetical protein
VDSTGLKLGGAGEWLIEKHGTRRRRSWRKLHLGVEACAGPIEAVELTTNDLDDGLQVGPLLDQVTGPIASFTDDGAYDRVDVRRCLAQGATLVAVGRNIGVLVRRHGPAGRGLRAPAARGLTGRAACVGAGCGWAEIRRIR